MLIIQTFKYLLTRLYVPDTQTNKTAVVTAAPKERLLVSEEPRP